MDLPNNIQGESLLKCKFSAFICLVVYKSGKLAWPPIYNLAGPLNQFSGTMYVCG